ncbi:hypothetical protein F5H01DRAFT_334990 [Linnemannia elongata]|nr:hypothetical protein F5H01DRAFT_334990 [Linnemannia elongata]
MVSQRLVVGVPLVWGWRVNGVGLVDGTRMSDRQFREEVFVVSESCLSGFFVLCRCCLGEVRFRSGGCAVSFW